MKRKIVLIGAGSASFTKGLMSDILNGGGDFEWTVALVDVNAALLKSVSNLCRKMINAKGARIALESSPDRRDMLPGADYVVATVGVGGRRAWENDVFIPRKYGIFQPVGDTAMPGGISRAMRMVPAMVDIARDIKELCPGAVFINYSNPMTVICRAIRKAAGVDVIGLCHGTMHTEGHAAGMLGYDKSLVASLCLGLNHLTFIYDLRAGERDLLPELAGAFNGPPDESYKYSWELFRAYGVFPAPGDRHITEFYPERFASGKYYGKTLGVDAYSFEGTIANGDRSYEETLALGADASAPLPPEFFAKMGGEHEQLIEIIKSLEYNERKIFAANLPNGGMAPELPADAILEMSAVAGGSGFVPLKAGGRLPGALVATLARHIAITETVADAALCGSRELFRQAVMAGACMADESEADKMVGELIEAQREYLPPGTFA